MHATPPRCAVCAVSHRALFSQSAICVAVPTSAQDPASGTSAMACTRECSTDATRSPCPKKVVKGRFVQRPHGGILLWTPHAKSACNRWMLTATAYPLKEAGEALMYGAGFQQPRWFRRRVDQPQEQTRDLSRLLGHHPRQLPRRHRPPPHRARSPS